uniref:Peptidase A1 domain-containing protein n=1 Tax=Acrobeloides nanus TaxID=290746 RepID=A0A914E942_9BILA
MEYYNECRRDIQTIHNKLLEAEREATGWGLVLKDVVAGVSDVVSNIFGSKKSEKNVNDVENVVNGAEKIVNGAKNVASGEDNIINDAKDVVKVAENVVNGAKDVVNDAENIVNGVKNIGDSANKISGDKNNIDENNVNERRKRDRNRDVRRNLEERHRQEKERLDKQRKEIDENNVNERRKRDLPSDRNRDVRRSLEARYKQEKDRLDKQRKEIDLVEEQIANFTAMVKNTDLERMDLEKVIEFISEATKYLILLHDKWSEMYKHFTRISIVIEENIVNKAGKIEDLEEVQKYKEIIRLNSKAAMKGSGGQGMNDYDDLEYIGNIIIGTPGQLFPFSKSSIYQQNGQAWEADYGDGSSTSGIMGVDTVTIGDPKNGGALAIPKTTFGQATYENYLMVQDPAFDGILGLAFTSLAVNGVTPSVINAINQGLLDQPFFMVWLEERGPIENVPGSYITYAVLDTTHCGSVIAYQQLSSATYFQFMIDRVSSGALFSSLGLLTRV